MRQHSRAQPAAVPGVQLRADGGGKTVRISGLAACYYREGVPGTEFTLMRMGPWVVVERLLKGCFDRAVREDDVRALWDHNPDCVLGRTASGTCRLSLDSTGLRYEIDADGDSPAVASALSAIRRGDVSELVQKGPLDSIRA